MDTGICCSTANPVTQTQTGHSHWVFIPIIRHVCQDIFKKAEIAPPVSPHPVALQVPHLDLQQRQVSEDLQVVLVPLQSVAVTLDGLIVLLIRALQEAVYMPAWDARGIKERSPSYSLIISNHIPTIKQLAHRQ